MCNYHSVIVVEQSNKNIFFVGEIFLFKSAVNDLLLVDVQMLRLQIVLFK
jgi:hypothetical protein